MGVISRMFNKLAQLSLIREGQKFALVSFYDGKDASFASVIEKWPELSGVVVFIEDPYASKSIVEIAEFDKVRSYLYSLNKACKDNKKIKIYIPTEIEHVQIANTTPSDFEVVYQKHGNQLLRLLPEDVTELADGWLRRNDVYWRYDSIDKNMLKYFRRQTISENEIVTFLSEELPMYRQAGVPIHSELEYSDQPAFSLRIHNFDATSAQIEIDWQVIPDEIDDVFDLEEHIVVGNVVHPGVQLAELRDALPGDLTTLEGYQLAVFLDDHYQSLKKWFQDELTAFESVHHWVNPPYRWELIVRSEMIGQIGRAFAHPIACVGNDQFTVAELQSMLQFPYARISTGWVRKQDLLSLGMNENGIMADGTSIIPIELDAEQLLCCGSHTIGNIWSAMKCEGAVWEQGGNKHIVARKHLEYLMYWGINGGVLGGYEAMAAYGIPLLFQLTKAHYAHKILIMGTHDDILALHEAYDSLLMERPTELEVIFIDYEAVLRKPGIRAKEWDLLLMIEPDAMTASVARSRMPAWSKLHAKCKIGFFLLGLDDQTAKVDAAILGYHENAELMTYLIRDCRETKSLPQAYQFHAMPIRPAASVQQAITPAKCAVYSKHDMGGGATFQQSPEEPVTVVQECDEVVHVHDEQIPAAALTQQSLHDKRYELVATIKALLYRKQQDVAITAKAVSHKQHDGAAESEIPDLASQERERIVIAGDASVEMSMRSPLASLQRNAIVATQELPNCEQQNAATINKVVFRKLDDGSAETVLPGDEECGIAIPSRERKSEATVKLSDVLAVEGTLRCEPGAVSDAVATTSTPTVELQSTDFFKAARKYADYEGVQAAHVPFLCYWPEYSKMDVDQLEWYFYLRSCIRRGEYPDTDLSYIFVYVYELLNLIGIRDATEGLKLLMAVRQAYSQRHLKLQHYLCGWIYDFVHLYDCGTTPQQIQRTLPIISETGLNEMLTDMAQQSTLELPLWVIERLSGYIITNSKFYQRGDQGMIERCITGALYEIDQQLRKRTNKNLLNTYAVLKMHKDIVPAFSGAICEQRLSYTVHCRHYLNSYKLSNFLRNVVRYTENVLRTQMKYKAKLQGITLDDRIRTWIDTYIAQQVQTATPQKSEMLQDQPVPDASVTISLDLNKLAQLRADSNEVREALLASMGEAPIVQQLTEPPVKSEDDLLTDLDAVQAVLKSISSTQYAMLAYLAGHAWNETPVTLKEVFPDEFLEVMVDEINEAASVQIGCSLIEQEGDSYIVAEDYRDELEYLMSRQEMATDTAWHFSLEDADPEWQAFFEKVDAELLGHLKDGMDAFNAYMKQCGEMPEPHLEELNNTAMDTIGDLLVTEDGIAAEYLPILQKHLVHG